MKHGRGVIELQVVSFSFVFCLPCQKLQLQIDTFASTLIRTRVYSYRYKLIDTEQLPFDV